MGLWQNRGDHRTPFGEAGPKRVRQFLAHLKRRSPFGMIIWGVAIESAPCERRSLMASRTIKEVLAGLVDVGASVIVEGWLRTRRDSKAGLSFLHVHDGSSFE